MSRFPAVIESDRVKVAYLECAVEHTCFNDILLLCNRQQWQILRNIINQKKKHRKERSINKAMAGEDDWRRQLE
jgi:hypothetical protein